MEYLLTKDITYRCYSTSISNKKQKSIQVVGLDTESYDTGQCFMICTSEGDVFRLSDIPRVFFCRRYENANFVCYNLSYDEGSILQFLPKNELHTLWHNGKVTYNDYKISIIPKKLLTIRKGSHAVKFYDMLNFYGGSLNYNSDKYLGEKKHDIETKNFSRAYVKANWEKLSAYCIQDAVLVKKLADIIIKRFEKMDVYPQRLYSTAYISYTYFRKHTNYVTVEKIWQKNRKALDYAMMSYNGGKFEITEKGTGTFYEYDIVSAYPYEIANLIDITYAVIDWTDTYQKDAIYGFLNVIMNIPIEIFSPIAVKKAGVNTYPCGVINKVITKSEYEYLRSYNVEINIINAVWFFVDKPIYPYRKEINKLVKLKQQYKHEKNDLSYHTIKILLNSLYGKFCQIIHNRTGHIASTCWNPIYASIITANTRIKITAMQQKYKSVIAVHTDSIISKKKLNFPESDTLGDFSPKSYGDGVMLGTGIYQIGDSTKFRGFESKSKLTDMINVDSSVINIPSLRKYGWREIAFHNWDVEYINRFVPDMKKLSCNFDTKRIWIDDYRTFKEVLSRNVESNPLFSDL